MSGEIVPFGKYKGKPLEAMLADTDYCEWLQGQEWFGSRYAEFKTVIINQGDVPSDTPEHNAFQARFIDDDVCLAVWWLVGSQNVMAKAKMLDDWVSTPRRLQPATDDGRPRIHPTVALLQAEARLKQARDDFALAKRREASDPAGFSVARRELGRALCACADADVAVEEAAERVVLAPAAEPAPAAVAFPRPKLSFRKFEEGGWDVFFGVRWQLGILQGGEYSERESGRDYIYCELKTSLGDDYPSVLRQIKSYRLKCTDGDWYTSHRRVLVAGRYCGNAVSIEDVRKIFAASDIRLVFMDELVVSVFADESARLFIDPHGPHLAEMPS